MSRSKSKASGQECPLHTINVRSKSKATDKSVPSHTIKIPTSRKRREKWGTRPRPSDRNQDQSQRLAGKSAAPHDQEQIKIKSDGQECPSHTVRTASVKYDQDILLFAARVDAPPGRDGEIGRRSGLKIRRSERTVGVRFPLPAPLNPARRLGAPPQLRAINPSSASGLW
jgi:hypothetical protein